MYKKDDLQKIQKIELEILRDFDEICTKNNIDYFLVGGSAIGVVRHGGFIPWDDDIDVGMSRKDYDRFITLAEDYKHKYNIINNDNYNELPIMPTRWSLKGTKFVMEELCNQERAEDFGIFLDIYCFDNVSDDDRKCKKQITKAWFCGKLTILSGVSTPVLYAKGIKKLIARTICLLGYYTLKIFGIKTRKLYLLAMKYAGKYKNINTKRFAYMFDPKRYTSLLNKKDVYPTKRAKFEDVYVNIPNDIDKYLTFRYGDYMKIPKDKEKHYHPAAILEFGDYFKDSK